MNAERPIEEVAAELGLGPKDLIPYGRDKAKIELGAGAGTRRGKLVLVSAITPTQGGEGKTTMTVAAAMGLRRLGSRVVACLREPSLGPVFGIKGGGTGGGRAIVVPDVDINLHFTGDLHAITSAHNLLAALVDNDLHFGGASGLVPERVIWPRALDMNDRALRRVTVQGGKVARETRFDITAASEVMAVLCLARSPEDLRARLGRIVVGFTAGDRAVTVDDLGAADAMAVLLKEALQPNLVQTAEGGPAILHGGPFANIAHGCSSVLGTEMGLRHADVVLTEAGFGFDLGGEKFLHIKCRQAGLWPHAVVLVATARALAAHGGGGGTPTAEAVRTGLPHLDRHIDAVRRFGLEPLVAMNEFADDPEAVHDVIARHCEDREVRFARCTGFAEGGAGSEALGRAILGALEGPAPAPRYLYDLEDGLEAKLNAVARGVYGADGVDLSPEAKRDLEVLEGEGWGELPVCAAKTHLSLSDDPKAGGMPEGSRVTCRGLRLSAGAGFVVALMGRIMTMPGLPRHPAAERIRIGPDGRVRGLMQGD